MHVTALSIYPVKSLGAVAVERTAIEPVGLAGDRRLMVVDRDGVFVSQRELPRLAQLRSEIAAGQVRIAAPGLAVDAGRRDGGRVRVRVWDSEVEAATVGPDADAALSDWLEHPVRLVAMDEGSRRDMDPTWAADGQVSFADGFPVLVTSDASLDDLNGRIAGRGAAPVPMTRFRPNVVIGGALPWAEDGWAAIRIGDVTLDLVKPCARCIVTTTDQVEGVRDGEEPLRTLATFRRSVDRRVMGVLFGWNAVARTPGTIDVGDPVDVLTARAPWPVR